MAEEPRSGLTIVGKLFSFLLILALIGFGAYIFLRKQGQTTAPTPSQPPTATGTATAPPPATSGNLDPGEEVAELMTSVKRLAPAAPYQVKDNTILVEISEYAGYAGLIAANGGLAPSENSVFFKKYGFKVKLDVSEEESWDKLNSGQMSASVTTADVLAAYGKQFQVVVPAQIGFSRGADGIVVRSDVKKFNGLRGKTLAAVQFTEADFFVRYLAQEAGLGVEMLDGPNAAPNPDKLNMLYCTDDDGAVGKLFTRDMTGNSNRLAGFVAWAPETDEVVEASGGKAHMLVTNKNLLIIADILIVNKGFAAAHPDMVKGLVGGLLEGNRMVRDNPQSQLRVVGKAFNWDDATTKEQLEQVHLSNLPENLAFFAGTITEAGSFGSIYQSAVIAYGTELVKDPVDSDHFVTLQHLKAFEQSGEFKDQKIAIAPRKSAGIDSPLESDPLLSKDIRFYFLPNKADLDLKQESNLKNLADVKRLLTVAPGSILMLVGHVDNAKIPEIRQKAGEAGVQKAALEAMDLSKRRAEEIKKQLIDREQVSADRLNASGRGWLEPAGTNSDLNRRVEVQWFTVE